MSWLFLTWWAGALFSILLTTTSLARPPRQLALSVLLALLWPLVAAVLLVGALLDLAHFLIAVAKKPH